MNNSDFTESAYNWPEPSEKAISLEPEIRNLENSLQDACAWVREMMLEVMNQEEVDPGFLQESLVVLLQTRRNYQFLLPPLLRFEQDVTLIGKLLDEFTALITCFEQVALSVQERMKFHS